MDRPLPRRGDRYRHYKGNEYTVLVITQAEKHPLFQWCGPLIQAHLQVCGIAIDEATGDQLLIFTQQSQCWALNLNENYWVEEPMVVYRRSDRTELKAWARAIDNFMDVLSNGRPVSPGHERDNQTMYYRFERIS